MVAGVVRFAVGSPLLTVVENGCLDAFAVIGESLL
jgi:hypothetical protein